MDRVIIFTERSPCFGLGHWKRCSLWRDHIVRYADERGMDLECWLHVYEGRGRAWFDEEQFKEFCADVALIDSYQAPLEIYQIALECFRRVVVLDDVARLRFPKDCVIINGALNSAKLYQGWENLIFAGIEYQALDPAFLEPSVADREDQITLAFGGSDEKNHTQRVYDALVKSALKARVEVILGRYYAHEFQAHPRLTTTIRRDLLPRDLARIYQSSALVVCGGGVMLNEVLATKTRALALTLAPNQAHQVREYAKNGMILTCEIDEVACKIESQIQTISSQVRANAGKFDRINLGFGIKMDEVLNEILQRREHG